MSIYCVVESPRELFGRLPGLQAYLDRFTRLTTDEACAIYELPGRDVRERKVAAVQIAEPLPGHLHGGHIDSPQPGAVSAGAMVELIGWVLGTDAPVVGLRVTHGRHVLTETATGVMRPDLAAAFPQLPAAATAGFRTFIDLADIPVAAKLLVTALFYGGQSMPIGTIITVEADLTFRTSAGRYLGNNGSALGVEEGV